MVSTFAVPRVAEFVKFHLQRISHAGAADAQLRHLSYRPERS